MTYNQSQYKGDRRPIENISWNEAQAFIWLMNFFGHRHYRLPSEAEWEYAARAGTATARHWGERAEDGCTFENIADLSLKNPPPDSIVANCDDGQAYTAPVESYKPNPWGIHDILGNVAEWVEDCYAEDYRKAPTNGSATTTSDCTRRIVRGGSWYISPRVLRAANRIGGTPGDRSDSLGFRLARTVTP